MKKKEKTSDDMEMRSHYDFPKGVRGKHAAEYNDGTNIVVLDPDIAKVFPDSNAVNKALRGLLDRPSPKRSCGGARIFLEASVFLHST